MTFCMKVTGKVEYYIHTRVTPCTHTNPLRIQRSGFVFARYDPRTGVISYKYNTVGYSEMRIHK